MIALWTVVGITGGYIATSVILLRFPWLVHKKKKQAFTARHISHRGGAGENLENTMTAFRHAVSQGTEMLEIDVQLTKDGQVVISHDNKLTRVSSNVSLISDLDFERLPLLHSTLDVTFAHGRTITSKQGDDRRIPLLRTLFEEFPGLPMNIDVKEGDEELITKVIDMLEEFDRKEISVLTNFHSKTINACYEKDPTIPVCFSIQRCVFLLASFYFGLLPFLPLKESFLELPLPRTILRRPDILANHRYLVHIADKLMMSPVLFRHLQRRGIQVYLWVINEEEDFAYCFDRLGVDGVMTDYPSKLSTYLNKKSE